MGLFNRKKKSEEQVQAAMAASASQQPTTASGMPITPSVAATYYEQDSYDVQSTQVASSVYGAQAQVSYEGQTQVPYDGQTAYAYYSYDAQVQASQMPAGYVYQNGTAAQGYAYSPYGAYASEGASGDMGVQAATQSDIQNQAAQTSASYAYGMSPSVTSAATAAIPAPTTVATTSVNPVQAVSPTAAASASNYAANTAAAAAKAAATAQAAYNYTAPTEEEMQVTAALTNANMPAAGDLRNELSRTSQKRRFKSAWRNAFFAIIAVAAISVLVSMLFMPVLRIYGSSMTPTLREGNVALAVKSGSLEPGEVVAFYYNNRVLIKRVIAGPGSWVDINDDGVVTVDGQELDEPYVSELALGECNIELPYQVPDNRYFVMGDHRATSVDSRSTTIGCVSTDQLVGRVIATIWPLNEFGLVS